MAHKVCILQGHPHTGGSHFCHALADAYADGARNAGATVETIDIAALDPEILHDPADFDAPPPPNIVTAQEAVKRCDHLVVIYPLWVGSMPAMTKAFFEQLCRANFAIAPSERGWPRKLLKGRSARVVVTMGMPAVAYRVFFGAHSLKGFEAGTLGMAGFHPVRDTVIGGVGEMDAATRARRLKLLHRLGDAETRRAAG